MVSSDDVGLIRSALGSISKEQEEIWLFIELRRDDCIGMLFDAILNTFVLELCAGSAPAGSSHGLVSLGSLGSGDGCPSSNSFDWLFMVVLLVGENDIVGTIMINLDRHQIKNHCSFDCPSLLSAALHTYMVEGD